MRSTSHFLLALGLVALTSLTGCSSDLHSEGASSSGSNSASSGASSSSASTSSSSSSSGAAASYWAKSFGGARMQHLDAVAVSPSGRIAIAGRFEKSIDLGAGELHGVDGAEDAFVAVLEEDGSTAWSHDFARRLDPTTRVALAWSDDDLILAGTMQKSSTVDFGAGPLSPPEGVVGGFVARFGPTGALVWGNGFGAYHLRVTSVAVAHNGTILVAGDFGGTLYLSTGPLTGSASDTSSNLFVMAMRPDGLPKAAHAVSVEKVAYARVFAGPLDGAILGGSLIGDADFGVATVHGALTYRLFGARYDAEMTPLYATLADPSPSIEQDMTTAGAAADGTLALVDHEAAATRLRTLDASGHLASSTKLAAGEASFVVLDSATPLVVTIPSGAQAVDGVAPFGAIVIAGNVLGPCDFGYGPLAQHGLEDIFVARLPRE